MSTEKQSLQPERNCKPELWGGIECTINRVNDVFRDQCEETGHYNRPGDIHEFGTLGIKKMRYPILWEKHQPEADTTPDFSWVTKQLNQLKQQGIEPIAALVHHGSGPSFTRLDDPAFPEKLAAYASLVAQQFPWIEYYTPVNEPLTTARFSGLYGFWFPHTKSNAGFLTMLLNELKGTVLAMKQIRLINPHAKLVQTEDLTKVQSTAAMQYQADFENNRRWLTYDLLCGKLDQRHPLWDYIISHGIEEDKLYFFLHNPCPPDIIGCNYYLTSERYLDENLAAYPPSTYGTNAIDEYADLESVRVNKLTGLEKLLVEVWERYGISLVVTEMHLNCTRDEQMRWLMEGWTTCCKLKSNGVDLLALTAWALLGSCDWNTLITQSNQHYESGVFDLRSNSLRKTILAKMITALASTGYYHHPVLLEKGWWHGTISTTLSSWKGNHSFKKTPLLIIGGSKSSMELIDAVCSIRSLPYVLIDRDSLCGDGFCNINTMLNEVNPWAVIHAVDLMPYQQTEKQPVNDNGSGHVEINDIVKACKEYDARFMAFLAKQDEDTNRLRFQQQDDLVQLNLYYPKQQQFECDVLSEYSSALIVKYHEPIQLLHSITSSFNINQANLSTHEDKLIQPYNDFIPPAYLVKLIHAALDIFLDEEEGIWHIHHNGSFYKPGIPGDLVVQPVETGSAPMQAIEIAELVGAA